MKNDEAGCSMARITKEELSMRIVVRRRAIGAAPFTWEVHQGDIGAPIHISPERFPSMEAAYRAGQARLREFLPQRMEEMEAEFISA
jgi:hypothetical protein